MRRYVKPLSDGRLGRVVIVVVAERQCVMGVTVGDETEALLTDCGRCAARAGTQSHVLDAADEPLVVGGTRQTGRHRPAPACNTVSRGETICFTADGSSTVQPPSECL